MEVEENQFTPEQVELDRIDALPPNERKQVVETITKENEIKKHELGDEPQKIKKEGQDE